MMIRDDKQIGILFFVIRWEASNLLASMEGATWNTSNVLHLRGRGCQDTGANIDPFG